MADPRPLNPAPCDIRPVGPEQTFAGRFTGRTLPCGRGFDAQCGD